MRSGVVGMGGPRLFVPDLKSTFLNVFCHTSQVPNRYNCMSKTCIFELTADPSPRTETLTPMRRPTERRRPNLALEFIILSTLNSPRTKLCSYCMPSAAKIIGRSPQNNLESLFKSQLSRLCGHVIVELGKVV